MCTRGEHLLVTSGSTFAPQRQVNALCFMTLIDLDLQEHEDQTQFPVQQHGLVTAWFQMPGFKA